jgi:predicted nucleic acid-binding protein
MPVLVDTSVWIDYFRKGSKSAKLDFLIDEDIIVTNDLIIAELAPFLKVRNEIGIIRLLMKIKKLGLSIDWAQIIEYQTACLKNGLNGVGIPDLIVAQNAIQNHCEVYTFDRHFSQMKDILKLRLLDQK